MKPTVMVVGLGRCGLTMTANMLAAAGLEVCGDPPAYEPEIPEELDFGADVVKVPDPINSGLTEHLGRSDVAEPPLRWIWLSRSAKAQARSIAKLVRAQGHSVDVKTLRESIRPDTRRHWRWIDRREEDLLKLRYGDVLDHPLRSAERIAAFLTWDVDEATMASIVHDRSEDAKDDLSTEKNLL